MRSGVRWCKKTNRGLTGLQAPTEEDDEEDKPPDKGANETDEEEEEVKEKPVKMNKEKR
ncbi:hypothetical protein M427DRAFT_64403 [Gonapodya prolifera JEL478]|uniref:Uncharacterized protein n=1 Tax=Gonapodya prolifera (strain JEL478) TaxID=1344416 RepID=A0A138ZXL2_GONPJ|nr:hypothetical protein M427DRAFT_64403 [Gonapodya prolifera JEL478]|eukprot:KXS09240.1 hypothetical protein M427DRAFT_64403 [Gonapodya prolifera JEL478]